MNGNLLVIFSNLLIVMYAIRTIRNVFYLVFLWQLKEYRVDRMIAHLKTWQGKKLIFGWVPGIKWSLFLLFIILYFYPSTDFLFYFFMVFTFMVYYAEGIGNLLELQRRGWRKPKWTAKAIFIVATGLIFTLLIILVSRGMFAAFIIGDKLLPIVMTVMVILLNIPITLYKKLIAWKAAKKMAELNNLTVIGITGSYGKTSTKEFLASILSSKFNILKTEESINTEIGVAKTILSKLTSKHEVFIVEMGAYKRGEIAAICGITHPKIGIITGINQQHIGLFGSIENTMDTKFELIKSLQMSGFAIFNSANKYVQKMADRARKERSDLSIWNYKRVDNANFTGKNLLCAYDIKVEADKLSFKLSYHGQTLTCETKLLGAQHVENVLGAACACLTLGFPFKELETAISKLDSPAKTMRLVSSGTKAILVDDTYNANPDGVLAALEYMKILKGVKILVLTPLIELGESADNIHKILGKKAAEICDPILLTNLNYINSFTAGASAVAHGEKKIQIVNSTVGQKIISQHLKEDGVVVFEGRESGRILELLLSKNS
jgi:UDP-N-acetylmuramoyl-tripeptide--D-alanyl-D-alanine ligase